MSEASTTIPLHQYSDYISCGNIPPHPPHGFTQGGWGASPCVSINMNSISNDWHIRKKCNDMALWTVIDEAWTSKLSKYIGDRTCVEIMSGWGWLAKALSKYGVDIVATDDFSWEDRFKSDDIPEAITNMRNSVTMMKHDDAVDRFSDRDILICSWPPYGSMDIVEACRKWGSDKPIIYIGEHGGGCCAPDEFFEMFEEIEDTPDFGMTSWYGIHDYICVGNWRRTKSK